MLCVDALGLSRHSPGPLRGKQDRAPAPCAYLLDVGFPAVALGRPISSSKKPALVALHACPNEKLECEAEVRKDRRLFSARRAAGSAVQQACRGSHATSCLTSASGHDPGGKNDRELHEEPPVIRRQDTLSASDACAPAASPCGVCLRRLWRARVWSGPLRSGRKDGCGAGGSRHAGGSAGGVGDLSPGGGKALGSPGSPQTVASRSRDSR